MALTEVAPEAPPAVEPPPRPRPRRVRQIFMRPRRVIVRVHRWSAIGLLAWLVIVSLTGTWLVVHHAVESWWNGDRYTSTEGDIGPQAAVDAARDEFPDATFDGITLPRNARGVYLVYLTVGNPDVEGEHSHREVYVDPGTGEVNDIVNSEAGATWWLYRGHMYLWQDWGLFGAFDPQTGWCRPDADGHEPGGAKGVACDMLPDGMDMVGWLAVGFVGVLLTGFYLWYWPGVRRWATAFVIKRRRGAFAFNMSVHKVVGFVVWVPLLVVAFTGMAFAFPNLNSWFENATPAERDFYLWTPPDDALSGEPEGRPPIGLDAAVATFRERYPERAVNYVYAPAEDDPTGTYWAWVTRGFDPWTRQGGAGNTCVALGQYTGETLYDGSPEEGNVFDQVWDDWSFPLHTGDFGGTATRLIWSALAITPVVLGVTGVTMYLIRRRKRARRHRPA